MSDETFSARQNSRRRPDRFQATCADPLHRGHPNEIGGTEPSARTRGTAGRKHVVRTRHVVTESLRALRADEDSPRTSQPSGHAVVVADDVLGSDALADPDGFGDGPCDDDPAALLQGRRCGTVAW